MDEQVFAVSSCCDLVIIIDKSLAPESSSRDAEDSSMAAA
jgi:hypothetical protein